MSDILKNKLEAWAPQPPQSVWQGVEAALSAADYSGIGQKLYQFGATPPPAVWENIETALTDAAPVIQLTPRRVWMRYAAGIAVAIALFYAGFNSLKTNQPQPDAAQQNIAMPGVNILSEKVASIVSPDTASKKMKRKPAPIIYRTKLPQINAHALALVQAATADANGRLYEVIAASTPAVNKQQLERYIVVSTAGEAAVKLPKKIYDLFRCEEVPDKIACTERLDNLRMQAAAPSLLATADFTGLLEMVQNVK